MHGQRMPGDWSRPSILAVAFLLGAAGCVDGPTQMDLDEAIPAGRSHEVNLDIEPGGRIEWEWSSSHPLSFDVHSHAGGATQDHVSVAAATSDQGAFEVDAGGEYSLRWVNGGSAAADLHLSLTYDGKVVS